MRRGAILAMAVVPLLLIAMWVRTPALPRTAGNASQNGVERVGASEGAMRALARALDACGGNIVAAARALGVARATLYRKIKRYGLKADSLSLIHI